MPEFCESQLRLPEYRLFWPGSAEVRVVELGVAELGIAGLGGFGVALLGLGTAVTACKVEFSSYGIVFPVCEPPVSKSKLPYPIVSLVFPVIYLQRLPLNPFILKSQLLGHLFPRLCRLWCHSLSEFLFLLLHMLVQMLGSMVIGGGLHSRIGANFGSGRQSLLTERLSRSFLETSTALLMSCSCWLKDLW